MKLGAPPDGESATRICKRQEMIRKCKNMDNDTTNSGYKNLVFLGVFQIT